ncbi:MAG TPA: hypothetical protein DET40_10765 [Lentisphaeria bacterium]|nr:MAG: hypothetical protein A2X45_11565 [Lentisphaerae bacterium GWF2_50_93]HCE44020.1 hypothetical protein [Lentisphaeria bacterium]
MRLFYPNHEEKAYRIAADAFAEYWLEITGEILKPEPVAGQLPSEGDLILIGADGANDFTHQLVKNRSIGSFDIRYGSDEYHMLSISEGKRDILVLAGGSGRSSIYAVYDFFRLRGKVEYFWDGDIFHYRGPVDVRNLDHAERPHFRYRGLRYFAHRGAHRFFPEMWDLDDWKKEIDWILKRRFNLFMLRIGMDDLFQRAFNLPYPPEDQADPDDSMLPHGRTALWTLRRRGKLREEVMAYARNRGLIHPEDTGAMSHWYTPAPSSFFEKHPDLPMLGNEKTPWYAQKNVAVWDIKSKQAVDLYWQLTEAHIREFGGGQPRMFHTIGLAERLYGETDEENLQLKLFTLRRTQAQVRRFYPDTPLLIAGWDLAMWWKSHDVKALCEELDPSKTIILDYNADQGGRSTFNDYETFKRFPWIFGMLHCLAFNNEMRGNYKMLCSRLAEAASDEKCLGFVLWPELSHSDTFAIEFVAGKSWDPTRLSASELVDDFCSRRYPVERSKAWNEIWKRAIRITGLVQWGEGEWPITAFDLEFHHRLLESEQFTELVPERIAYYRKRCAEVDSELSCIGTLFDLMAALPHAAYDSPQERRDMIDVARAEMNLTLRTMFMAYCVRLDAWRAGRQKPDDLKIAEEAIRKIFSALADLLEQNDDFSLRISLEKLKIFSPLNPVAETKLKENASCSYCRNQTSEVVRHLYLPEMDAYFKTMNEKIARDDRSPFVKFETDPEEKGDVSGFCELPVSKLKKEIAGRFIETPLSQMPFLKGPSRKNLVEALGAVKEALNDYFNLGGAA